MSMVKSAASEARQRGDYRIAVGEAVVNGPSSRRSVSWCVVRDVVGFVDAVCLACLGFGPLVVLDL
jgi:hypothetical protein